MFNNSDGSGMMGSNFGGYGGLCILISVVIVAIVVFAFRGRKS